MLVPLSWLKDYVDIDVNPDVLEEKLFSCGFEVEEKYEVGHDSGFQRSEACQVQC